MKRAIFTLILEIFLLIKPQRGDAENKRISHPAASYRIVNGKFADITDFPYQLSLRRNTVHICGASVLSDFWAITAAHCIYAYSKSPRIFSLRGGSNFRLTGGIITHVDRLFHHPSFNPLTYNYDVGLLHTVSSLLRGHIVPIQLPKVNEPLPEKTKTVISGWGYQNPEEAILAKVLQYTIVYIFNQESCTSILKDIRNLTDTMFCAAASSTDACQGDSGGPIQMNGILIGVTSWGVGCADPIYPGIYSRLSHPGIRQWIKIITRL